MALDNERIAAALWIACGLGLVLILGLLARVLTPFVLGAVMAYLLVPGVDWLQRHRLPRPAAGVAMILLAGMCIFGLVLILVPILQVEIDALREEWPGLVNRLNTGLAPWVHEHFGWTIRFDVRALTDLVTAHVGQPGALANSVLAQLRTGGAVVLTTLVILVLVPIVAFYLLMEWHAFMGRCEAAIPRRWRDQVVQMLTEIDTVLSQFLRGQLSVMATMAIFYGAALSLVGLSSGLAIGVLTGALLFIPYIGFALGLVLGLVAAALQFDGWVGLLPVAAVFTVGKLMEDFVLTPRLVGKRMGLHPLAVIFALLAFAELFGFLGILVALPSCAVLLVALRRIKRAYLSSAFYGRP